MSAGKSHDGAQNPAATRRRMLATAATGLLAGAGGVVLGGAATSGSPALAATVATPDWLNVVSYGADPTGGIVAAPAAGKIIERIAPFLGIQKRAETNPYTPADPNASSAAEEH